LAEGRVEGISALAAARRGPEEGRRRPSSRRYGHALALVDYKPEHGHATRLDVTDAPPELSRSLRVRSGSVQRGCRSGARRRDRPARSPRGTWTSLVDQDDRLEGLPHRRTPRRQDTYWTRCALCQCGGDAVREPC